MTSDIIPLLSTCVGAGAVILAQFVAVTLKDKGDLKKIKFDLIAEERRLANMLLLNQTGAVRSAITTEFHYQLSEIESKAKDRESSIERYNEEIKFGDKLDARYSLLIGDYCKNIYQLSLYIGNVPQLETLIQKIINHSHEDFTDKFEKFKKYKDLYNAYTLEHDDVSKKLKGYKSYFDQIREIIEQATN